MAGRKPIELGQCIVSDPEICGGDLTFKGTRILVKDVLHYVSQGKDWDWIVEAYDRSLDRKAIQEAVDLSAPQHTELSLLVNEMAITLARAQAEAQSMPAEESLSDISDEEIEALAREAVRQGRRDAASADSQ